MYRILHIPSGEYVTYKRQLSMSGKGHTKYYFNPKKFHFGEGIALFFWNWSASLSLWRKVPKTRRAEYLVVPDAETKDPNEDYD